MRSFRMADTREAGELRARGCPSADCQGEDIQTRGLVWAQCHMKGAIPGKVSGVVAPIYLPPDARRMHQTEVRLRNVLPLTICGGTPPRTQLPGLRRSVTRSWRRNATVWGCVTQVCAKSGRPPSSFVTRVARRAGVPWIRSRWILAPSIGCPTWLVSGRPCRIR
jgi:hypothetical protein